MKTVTIVPVNDGWAVKAPGIPEIVVSCGSKAEETAERLATALREGGEAVELRVEFPDRGHVGRFVCPPDPSLPGIHAIYAADTANSNQPAEDHRRLG